MIKRHTESRTLEVSVIDACICNGCGLETKPDKDGRLYGNHEYGDGIHVKYSGGYSSRLGDGTEFDFDLCDECVKKLIDSFKVPVVKNLAAWLGGGVVDEDGALLLHLEKAE